MYYSSPISSITPALVSVAMSRSDSRDSNYSTISTASDRSHQFAHAPMTVSYSSSYSYNLGRTVSNTSSTSTTSSYSRRASSQSIPRRDSTSTWISSPYKSCQLQGYEEPSSFLSDDDLLYIAPATQCHDLPLNAIPEPRATHGKQELTTEEQIAMMREMQDKEQEELMLFQQQRRQAAAAAQKAVRFADQKPRRPSHPRRRTPTVRKGLSQLNGPQ